MIGADVVQQVLWTFSIVLESVCVLPQLLLLRQTTVPTVIDSFYLVTLGSYRAFYILNWILRLAVENHFDAVAFLFGIIQTALYIDFAWVGQTLRTDVLLTDRKQVYWTRQRVKLRSGGVVDSDDIGRGYLIGHLLGRGTEHIDEESEPLGGDQQNGISKPSPTSWGSRGISVSADDHHIPDPTAHAKNPNGNQSSIPDHFEDAD